MTEPVLLNPGIRTRKPHPQQSEIWIDLITGQKIGFLGTSYYVHNGDCIHPRFYLAEFVVPQLVLPLGA